MSAFFKTTLCLVIVSAGVLVNVPAMAQPSDGHVVWSQYSQSQYSLKMSRKQSHRWSPPEMIEKSDNPMIVPTLSEHRSGDVYAAWTELYGDQGRIRFAIKRHGVWGPSKELLTTTSSDMAPEIMIDTNGTPWMVWSGTDETDDDIYFSRWMGYQWLPPERINQNDQWPDILPSIGLDGQNRISATWQGYNGERYVRYSSYWTGKNWSREYVIREILHETDSSDQELPAFIPKGSQGSLHSGGLKPVHRFVKPAPIR